MKLFVAGTLFIFLLVANGARAQDDDDMGDGAYGADDGGDDGGYDSPADGDDDGGYDSPADGDDDMGGDESRPQPEYVSTIERDEDPDESDEQVDSSQRVELAVLPHPGPQPAAFGRLLYPMGLTGPHSMTPHNVVHHRRSRRSVASANSPFLSRMKRSGHQGGVVGPVHTYVRTDYDGNYRWGARHHVGSSYGRGK